VPGKVVVIGITGGTLVALGEVAAGSTATLEPPPDALPASTEALPASTEALPASFASTLDHSTRRLADEERPQVGQGLEGIRDHITRRLADEETPSDVLLKISEAIQQKVSLLKQL
jgi:hypothetical protein